MTPFYVTTPIYYVSGAPHVGHAYTSVAADALARYHRARGAPTWFLTGTDEHGEKIETAASKAGVGPLAFADAIVEKFKAAWDVLDIGFDDFIRTTEPRHEQLVVDLWKRIEAAGDIYLDHYEGWYCIECEAFYTDAQMAEGKICPIHVKPLSWVKEPSFFFRMSKYEKPLLEHFEKHPGFVQPDSRRNEIVAFIKTGLRDLSVSRTTFKWGIPVPGHPDHVIYVWLDALANYMTALGGPGAEKYETFWRDCAHLIGKDILRFHAVYWPCFLMSAGLPLPKTLFVHGWWTLRGQKISKSLPATRIDPVALAADIGADALRYFLLREVPLGLDGDFTYETLIGRINSDLANDLGNLLNRTLAMVDKYVGGVIPKHRHALDSQGIHAELAALAARCKTEAERCYEAFAPSRALEAIWELVRAANRYVDAAAAWTLAKDPEKKDELGHVLHTFLESVLWAALMVQPVMPRKAGEILAQLGLDPAAWKLRWPKEWNHDLPHGGKIAKGAPLFPRIDEARQAELLAKWIPADAAVPVPVAVPGSAPVTVAYEDFARLDLRVAVVKSAERVPKADKLLKLQLDVGGETRQVVAGVAETYSPEELVGKRVIFLANLAPRKIRGTESQGMILAAGDEKVLALSALDRDVAAGTKIK